MHKDNPADRSFERQDAAKQPYDDARETYSEKQAKLDREASAPQGPEENLSDEERKALLEQNAEESFKEIGKKRSKDLDSSR